MDCSCYCFVVIFKLLMMHLSLLLLLFLFRYPNMFKMLFPNCVTFYFFSTCSVSFFFSIFVSLQIIAAAFWLSGAMVERYVPFNIYDLLDSTDLCSFFFSSPLHFPLPYCCKERCKMCLMCQSSFLFFFACSFFACTLYCKAKTNIFFLLPCVCERIKMTVLMFYYFIYVKQKHS